MTQSGRSSPPPRSATGGLRDNRGGRSGSRRADAGRRPTPHPPPPPPTPPPLTILVVGDRSGHVRHRAPTARAATLPRWTMPGVRASLWMPSSPRPGARSWSSSPAAVRDRPVRGARGRDLAGVPAGVEGPAAGPALLSGQVTPSGTHCPVRSLEGTEGQPGPTYTSQDRLSRQDRRSEQA